MATKRYLDYAGLKRVLAKLLPGARKIWHGTLAEWKALPEAERDKYDQAEIIDGSGYQSDYIRNLHDPDWAKAVKLDHEGLYMDGYNAPSNGIIVGYFTTNSPGITAFIKINNISVAFVTISQRGSPSFGGNVQCPVNKSDHITLETNLSIEANRLTSEVYFVPYKAQ